MIFLESREDIRYNKVMETGMRTREERVRISSFMAL